MSKLILLLVLTFAFGAFADDDEMKTDVKPGTATTAPPAVSTGEPPKGPAPSSKLDPQLRAKIRSKAPFWIDDTTHGAAVRINKDGTISSETQGGGSIAGSWKALKGGQLEISWSDGGEKYTYPVTASGGKLQIKGRAPAKNRYKLN